MSIAWTVEQLQQIAGLPAVELSATEKARANEDFDALAALKEIDGPVRCVVVAKALGWSPNRTARVLMRLAEAKKIKAQAVKSPYGTIVPQYQAIE